MITSYLVDLRVNAPTEELHRFVLSDSNHSLEISQILVATGPSSEYGQDLESTVDAGLLTSQSQGVLVF